MEQLTIGAAQTFPFEPGGEQLFRDAAKAHSYPRQAAIYAPGEPATQAYLVAQGEVRLSRCTPDGRELTLEHVGPGAVFGVSEMLLGCARDSHAEVRAECTVHALERETLLELAGTHAAFGLWLTRQVTERQLRMENRLETLLFKSANGKVAQVLLQLAEAHGRACGEGTLIDYPITHQEIGNLIATTRETVSYAFMEFRQQGLIATHQRRTVVVDREGLRWVAQD